MDRKAVSMWKVTRNLILTDVCAIALYWLIPSAKMLVLPLLNGTYGEASGTSLAAAQTAGVAALMFEWAIIRKNQPYFTGTSVKNYLQRGARREENYPYPNREWGYGRMDLYHTFELLT